jgi:hypothetical protein
MKIQTILNERQHEISPIEIFKSLSPLQIGAVKRIAAGNLDPFAHELSEKTHALLDSLIDMGVLEQDYSLSPLGQRIHDISSKVASKDVRDARKAGFRKEFDALKRITGKNQRPTNVEDEDDEDDGEIEDLDVEDETIAKPLRARKKPAVRELERDDFKSFDKDDMNDLDDEGEYRWS